jgi:hypothetical protein
MTSANEATLTSIQGCTFKLIEIPSSGIRLLSREEGFTIQEPKSGTVWTKLQQWLLGLNMKKYGIGHEK